MIDIRPIRSEADYQAAMVDVERYFDDPPEPGTSEGDRFEVLTALIERYEQDHHPVPDADPVDVLRFALDSLGRSQSELAALLGSRSRASEILLRKRPLTLDQVRTISAAWHLPISALTGAYQVTSGKPASRRSGARVRPARSRSA